MTGRLTDRYAPCERQETVDGVRYVRLTRDPMPLGGVLPWLEEQGLVQRRPADGDLIDADDVLVGWGTTYYAVPWGKSVDR